MAKALTCYNKTTATPVQSKLYQYNQSFAKPMQATLRADGTDTMMSSSIT